MRQLFRSQYNLRANPILINYQNNFHQFSFLENDFTQINTYKPIFSSKAKNFIETTKKYRKNLIEIQQYDFKEDDLRILQNPHSKQQILPLNYSEFKLWKKNQNVINEVRDSFNQMQYDLYTQSSKNNLKDTILALTQFNCIQLRTWQRMSSLISSYYKKSNLEERSIQMTALSEYLKKFQFAYNVNKKPAFKFMYPESYIIDLVDFRDFFKSIENQNDFVKQHESESEETKKLELLQSQIYLIMKATKKADMNIYSVRQYFEKRIDEMIRIAGKHKKSTLHESLLYNIYFIYSYLNYNNDKFYVEIQKSYFEYLRKVMKGRESEKNSTFWVSNKSKQMTKLLSIWKLNQRPNFQIYEQLLKPFLKHILDQGLQQIYYSNIGINLLTAGIKDNQIIHQMVQKCQTSKIKDDEFMHMLKHYLNVMNNKLIYPSDYKKCQSFQNPSILNYFSDQQKPIFSSCLDTSHKFQNKGIYHKSSELHRIQKIWLDIIKNIFSPKFQVIENANICNYQIDIMILSKVGIYAIQIEGGHYNKKQLNKERQTQTNEHKSTGKRQMRQSILRAYGVKFIKIHCQEKLPTYIMQSRNFDLAKKFIIEKIEKETGLNIQNI